MTITFTCPAAPDEIRRVPCDSPSYGLTCTPEERCGYCDDGWMSERTTECPEVQLANPNAAALIRLLGLEDAPGGDIPLDAIPGVLRGLMVALNRESDRDHLVREPSEGRGHEPRVGTDPDSGLPCISCGPKVIDCGNTDEQTVRRLTNLRDLLVWAQERGYDVSWG
jgi:hypothetical protein